MVRVKEVQGLEEKMYLDVFLETREAIDALYLNNFRNLRYVN